MNTPKPTECFHHACRVCKAVEYVAASKNAPYPRCHGYPMGFHGKVTEVPRRIEPKAKP